VAGKISSFCAASARGNPAEATANLTTHATCVIKSGSWGRVGGGVAGTVGGGRNLMASVSEPQFQCKWIIGGHRYGVRSSSFCFTLPVNLLNNDIDRVGFQRWQLRAQKVMSGGFIGSIRRWISSARGPVARCAAPNGGREQEKGRALLLWAPLSFVRK
jgi:hypothetical protein